MRSRHDPLPSVPDPSPESLAPLRALLDRALADPTRPQVTLDLRGVAFLDAVALGQLAHAVRALRPRGMRPVLYVDPGGQPDRVLRLAGFHLCADLRSDR